jgi:hypothetical protein
MVENAMQNAAAGDVVPLDDRDEGFYMIVSELVSLIDRVQAGIARVETAQAQQATADAELADVVVLDDVTPFYVQASAVLGACNASLSTAL